MRPLELVLPHLGHQNCSPGSESVSFLVFSKLSRAPSVCFFSIFKNLHVDTQALLSSINFTSQLRYFLSPTLIFPLLNHLFLFSFRLVSCSTRNIYSLKISRSPRTALSISLILIESCCSSPFFFQNYR